jgi:hypothetical protein
MDQHYRTIRDNQIERTRIDLAFADAEKIINKIIASIENIN